MPNNNQQPNVVQQDGVLDVILGMIAGFSSRFGWFGKLVISSVMLFYLAPFVAAICYGLGWSDAGEVVLWSALYIQVSVLMITWVLLKLLLHTIERATAVGAKMTGGILEVFGRDGVGQMIDPATIHHILEKIASGIAWMGIIALILVTWPFEDHPKYVLVMVVLFQIAAMITIGWKKRAPVLAQRVIGAAITLAITMTLFSMAIEKHAPTVYDEYVTTEDSVGGWDTAKNLLAAMGRTTKDAFNATADFLDGDDGRERKQDEAQIRRLAAKENKSTGGETSSRSLTQEEKLRNILKKIE